MTFGMDDYKEEKTRYTSFIMKDNNIFKFCILNSLITGADYNTPTIELLEATGNLFVHQMLAFQTTVMSYKVQQSK